MDKEKEFHRIALMFREGVSISVLNQVLYEQMEMVDYYRMVPLKAGCELEIVILFSYEDYVDFYEEWGWALSQICDLDQEKGMNFVG